MSKRDFLAIDDLTAGELLGLVDRALVLARIRDHDHDRRPLAGKTLAIVFEKASTRTRVSFEVAATELGAYALCLDRAVSQLGRGEPMRDTARVLGAYCHGVVIRTFAQERAAELAQWAPVPVINGLTDRAHPCQVLADLCTVKQRLGRLHELRYAWVGDGNNVANSWIAAAGLLGLDLTLACPEGFRPDVDILARARTRQEQLGRGRIALTEVPAEAVQGAHVVSTDVWTSMGQEDDAEARRRAFSGYRVDDGMLAGADEQAIVLHCLPAHRGEEITDAVIEGPRSAVWQQAENRLHAQKALLEALLGDGPWPEADGPQ
ncbi:ornithine carbamoyltransferase [Haliangium sp.]|uniref:ornithine carbamoyltransferase n=1 Tax=Haliangium sp. TaxID=2663208 RepID=UPI003D14F084